MTPLPTDLHKKLRSDPKACQTQSCSETRCHGQDVAKCQLQQVKMSGSMMDVHEASVRAAPLDGATPFGFTLDIIDLKLIVSSLSCDIATATSFSLRGEISEDEPFVLSPGSFGDSEKNIACVSRRTRGRCWTTPWMALSLTAPARTSLPLRVRSLCCASELAAAITVREEERKNTSEDPRDAVNTLIRAISSFRRRSTLLSRTTLRQFSLQWLMPQPSQAPRSRSLRRGCRADRQATMRAARCLHRWRSPVRAQTQSDEWRHAEPSAAHSFVSPCSGSLSRTSHRKDNNLLSKVKAESSQCVSSLRAEQADLVETEKSLTAVVIAHSRQSNNDDGESRHEVNSGVPSKRTGLYIRSAKRFITGCDDKERFSERIVKEFVNVLALVVMNEIFEGIESISQECIWQRTVEEIVDVLVPQVREQIVEVPHTIQQERVIAPIPLIFLRLSPRTLEPVKSSQELTSDGHIRESAQYLLCLARVAQRLTATTPPAKQMSLVRPQRRHLVRLCLIALRRNVQRR